jgi:chitodextrinase
VGVTGYRVTRNGSTSFTVAGTTYSDTSVASNTAYSYTVSAADAAGNRSLESTAVQVATPPAPTQTYRLRESTTGYRVRQVYTGSGGVRGAAMTIPGAYGQATSVYVDAGNPASLPTCNANNTVTSNGTVYMAVTAPAVSQHGLSILGQNVTGYVTPCDLQ